MFSAFQNFMYLLRVIIIFFLLFYFLPSRMFKTDDKEYEFGTLDRFFVYFTHSNLITILIVYTLALIGIYETVSLLISYILIFALFIWQKKKKEDIKFSQLGMHYFGKTLDVIENDGGLKKVLFARTKSISSRVANSAKSVVLKFYARPIENFLVSAVFLVGAYTRFHHSFVHLFYGASDPYVHLAWTKYLGNNQIFRDGVYPYGYHAILSSLSKVFFTDPSVIIRFIGPIASCVMILSIYYVLRKIVKSSLIPAVLGVGIYILNTTFSFGALRQIAALPEEYAMIFLLPGMYFLHMFFIKEKKYFLLLSAEALLVTILIHPYVTIFMAVGYVIVSLMHIRTLFKKKNLIMVGLFMLVSGIIGVIPIGLGLLSGKEFHRSSIDFILDSTDASVKSMNFKQILSYMASDKIFIILFVCLGILLLFSVIRLFLRTKDHREQGKIGIIFSLFTFILYLQYRALDMGIPYVMHPFRTSLFLSFVAAFTIALVVGSLDLITTKKYIGNIIKAVAAIAIIFMLFDYSKLPMPLEASPFDCMEYDEAAYAHLKIKQDFQINNWTVVSPVEQYSESINYGYHYNIWEYVKNIDVDDKDIEFPTEHVFWFVEKIPLRSDSKITKEDAQKDFPTITGNLDEYYTKPENRRIIEAKAYYILEDLLAKDENMSVYLETENFKVYMLHQNKFAVDLVAHILKRSV